MENNQLIPQEDSVNEAVFTEAGPESPALLPASKKNKYILWGALGFLLLAVGVFVGARLLNQQSQGQPNGVFMSANGGNSPHSVSIEMKGAPELPEESSVIMGTVQKIDGNRIFITEQSRIGVIVKISDDGNSSTSLTMGEGESAPKDGELKEVVITKETAIYREITDFQTQFESGVIQQEVKEIDAKEIGPDSIINVWGDKQGGRIIASHILYIPGVKFSE